MSENIEPLAIDEDGGGADDKRQRSTIAFPYSDYDSAAAVATAIHANAGHGDCSPEQLAAWMTQSVKSSGFRTQLAAAKLFGLIRSDSPESIRLTALGIRVLDPAQQRIARADAFLNVPLFKSLFENYKTGVTPPAAALEREIVRLGVSEKQKARARQVFESSATATGFRASGQNRLVMPAVALLPPSKPEENLDRKGGGNDGNDGGGLELDPLLMALLRKIPKSGEAGWPPENRLRWFRTFAMNVSQVYDDDNSPVEMNITIATNGDSK